MSDLNFESVDLDKEVQAFDTTLSFLESLESFGPDASLVAYGRSMGYMTTTAVPFFAVEAVDDTAADVAKTKSDAAERLAAMQGRFEASLASSDKAFSDLSIEVEKKVNEPHAKMKVAPAVIAGVVGALLTAKDVVFSMTERSRIENNASAAARFKEAKDRLMAKMPVFGKTQKPVEVPEETKTLLKKGTDAVKSLLHKLRIIKAPELVPKKVIPTAWEAATPKQRIIAAGIVFAFYAFATFVVTHVVLRLYRWIKAQFS